MRKNTSTQNEYRMSSGMRGMYGSVHNNYYEDDGLSGIKDSLQEIRDTLSGKKKHGTREGAAGTGSSMHGTGSSLTAGSVSGNRRTSSLAGAGTRSASRSRASRAGITSAGAIRKHAGSGRHSARVRAAAIHRKLPVEIVKGHRISIDSPAERLLPSLEHIRKRITLRGVLLALLAATMASAAVILLLFNFKTAAIYGNTKYSQEQIESFITRGRLGDNTFVMALKYHHRKVKDIPFVDQIDIDLVSPSTVRVNITEKPLDGCIFYGGQNVYFSKEGTIETVSGRVAEEATKVNGVVLTHSNTASPILAKNQLGLDLTLEVLREMDKYGIHADEINVDEKSNLTVSFGDVDVKIGKTGYEQKMYRIHQILPYMEGRSGVISMTGFEYDYSSTNIVLSPKGAEDEDGSWEEEEMEPVDAVASAG